MKPILFNTEMVQALLEGRKTVTRRVAFKESDLRPFPRESCPDGWWFRGRAYRSWDDAMRSPQGVMSLFRYHTGDILYVRETWQQNYDGSYAYRAGHKFEAEKGWHPSIHMPKEAARLFLRITNVRVERLQDITDEQALSEGVPDDCDYPLDNPVYCPVCKGEGLIGAFHPVSLGYMEVDCPRCDTPRKRFSNLWDSTIKKADLPRYGWAANPWVWMIEFERCEKPKEEPT